MSADNKADANSLSDDAIAQANAKALGDAPVITTGSLYQIVAESAGVALQNAVAAQQNENVENQSATAEGVNLVITATSAATTPAVAIVRGVIASEETLRELAHDKASGEGKP